MGVEEEEVEGVEGGGEDAVVEHEHAAHQYHDHQLRVSSRRLGQGLCFDRRGLPPRNRPRTIMSPPGTECSTKSAHQKPWISG